MHTAIMWVGGIIAGFGILFTALIIGLGYANGGAAAILTGLGIGGAMFLSGAMLYCFGAIVDHLQAIRRASEDQLRVFTERVQRSPSQPL